MTADDRIEAARDLHRRLGECAIEAPEILDLIAYAEERLRVNEGLLRENQALKARASGPEVVDLSTISNTVLLATLAARLQEV